MGDTCRAMAAALTGVLISVSAVAEESAARGEVAIAALQCSYLAPDRDEEQRLLALGRNAAQDYIDFARSGGEPDFTYEFAHVLTNLQFDADHMPSDDFAIGALYNGLLPALDGRLAWIENNTAVTGQTPREKEFNGRNCRVLR